MSRTLVGLSIVVVGVLTAACGGSAPAGATAPATAGSEATGAAAATVAATSAAGSEGGRFETELTVEQLCAALTPEELSTILGADVAVDPAETEWCGYDLEDGSGMFVVGNSDTAEEFTEQVQGFDCDARTVSGGAVLSSCGNDKEEGRPSEAWFLLDGVGVQLSVDVEATEAQYVEMVREALD
jgi:hypothetical protein